MRTNIVILLLLALATIASAQSTTVSGTITDAGAQVWQNGTYSFTFQPAASNPTAQYYWNGSPFSSSQTFSGNLSGAGAFTQSVPSSTAITPSGSAWVVQVCPAASSPCYNIPLTITGTTQSISGQVIPPAVQVNLANAPNGVAAYTDSEITGAKAGNFYFNLTDSSIHTCNGFPPCTWGVISSASSILGSNNSFTGVNTFTQPIVGSITGNAATATAAVTATNLFGPGTVTGNYSHSGTETFSANPIIAPNVNSIRTVDGTTYATPTAALAACPSAGCTIDMRGGQVLSLGSFDPGTKTVNLLLGPFSYTLTQMVVRSGLHVIGVGSNATSITQASASTAPFVLPNTTSPGNIAIHVLFQGFSLIAAPSSTTDGFSMVGLKDGGGSGGGIWYSRWEDIQVGTGTPFGRNQIRLDTTENLTASPLGANQFLSFQDVFAFRAKNGPPTLMITGSFTGQISFNNCQFDGAQSNLDTSANIYNIRVDDGGTAFTPYSIAMTQVTSQWVGNGSNSAGIFLGGVSNFSCENCHFENLSGLIIEALGAGTHGNVASIHNSYIATNVGRNSGSGFIANLDGSSALEFNDNAVWGTPDNLITGTQTFFTSNMQFNPFGNTAQNPSVVNMGFGVTVANLPSAASNPGQIRYVFNSTTISAEGQTCVDNGGSGVKAFAWSNGSVWKCF